MSKKIGKQISVDGTLILYICVTEIHVKNLLWSKKNQENIFLTFFISYFLIYFLSRSLGNKNVYLRSLLKNNMHQVKERSISYRLEQIWEESNIEISNHFETSCTLNNQRKCLITRNSTTVLTKQFFIYAMLYYKITILY